MSDIKITYFKYLLILFSTLLFIGCSAENEDVEALHFSPNFSGVVLDCDSIFSVKNKKWRYQKLQMYITNVQLQNKKGDWISWPMTVTNYQHSEVALIGENCLDDQEQANWKIEFAAMPKLTEMSKIRFTLGVPFELNHLNPLTQTSPLNESSMFWVWQTGHKFLRVELASADDNWLFHLGSTGCSAPSVMRAPAKPCKQPNQVLMELPFNTITKSIDIDLAGLLKGVTVTKNNSCQSAPDDKNCQQLLNNIGVNSQQQVFSINAK